MGKRYQPRHFCFAEPFKIGDYSYVVLAPVKDKSRDPEREEDFFLLRSFQKYGEEIDSDISEDKEGVFTSRLEPSKLKNLLLGKGFIFEPNLEKLDSIREEYLDLFKEDPDSFKYDQQLMNKFVSEFRGGI